MTQSTTQLAKPPAGLNGARFKRADTLVKRRMITSVEGEFGTGKTDLALTAPGPIAFFKLDLNSDFTVAQWADKKTIYKNEVPVPKDGDDVQKEAKAIWTQFTADYAAAIASPDIRTIIWDTATEAWDLCRLAAFGRLSNVMPHFYAPVNTGFRALIKSAFDSDTNLILVHRLKDEWVNTVDSTGKEKGRPTGRKVRAGFTDIGFAVQVMVQTFFDPENADSPFQMKVLKCTQNPMVTNRVYGQVGDLRLNSFPALAADVFPGTAFEDWE